MSAAAAAAAFAPKTVENINVSLGVTNDVDVSVEAITVAEQVEVTGVSDPVFASTRTGAATSIDRERHRELADDLRPARVDRAIDAAGERHVVRRAG